MDRHLLSPMYDAGSCHYYIDEPARLRDGRTVVPIRWLENEESGEIVADAWLVEFDENVSTWYSCCYYIDQLLTRNSRLAPFLTATQFSSTHAI